MPDVSKMLDTYRRKYGIDIAVIDDSGFVGTAASITHLDEVYMDSAESMVANVLKKRDVYDIRRLDILDHGNEQSFQLGDDWISDESITKFAPVLGRLKPAFGASGFVHLQHCGIGMNKSLLVKLAQIWDVSVYAGTGSHNPVYRINYGSYVRADPNGSVTPAGRPDEDSYQTYIGMKAGGSQGFLGTPEATTMKVTGVAYEDAPPPAAMKPKLMGRSRR